MLKKITQKTTCSVVIACPLCSQHDSHVAKSVQSNLELLRIVKTLQSDVYRRAQLTITQPFT